MNQKLKVGLYCRISQEDEMRQESSASIVNQKKKLTDFALQNNMPIYSTYCDDGYSGTNFDRPAFKQLIADIEKKKVNCVIVKDLSRLGREYIQSGNLLENFFPKHSTRFISLDDNIDRDPENPTLESNMMIPFFNLMNEFYPSDISKKTRSALRTKASHGEYVGSLTPYGYIKSPENKNQLLIDDRCSHWVRFIYDKFLNGWSLSKIAKELHKENVHSPSDIKYNLQKFDWNTSTIRGILKNELYCGKTIYGKKRNLSYKNRTQCNVPREKWIIVENTHEPLISQEQFNQVQELLALCSQERISTTTHPFIGKLYCPDCGELLNFCREPRKSNPKEGYYVCRTNKKYGKSECSRHYIRLSVLEVAIVNELVRLSSLAKTDRMNLYKLILSQKEIQAQRLRDCVNVRLEQSNKRIIEVEKIITALYSDKVLGAVSQTEYDVISEKLTTEYKQLSKQISEDIEYLDKLYTDSSSIDRFIDELITLEKDLSSSTWNTFNRLIDRIAIEDKVIKQGKEEQYIKIYYRYIGLIEPLNVL